MGKLRACVPHYSRLTPYMLTLGKVENSYTKSHAHKKKEREREYKHKHIGFAPLLFIATD